MRLYNSQIEISHNACTSPVFTPRIVLCRIFPSRLFIPRIHQLPHIFKTHLTPFGTFYFPRPQLLRPLFCRVSAKRGCCKKATYPNRRNVIANQSVDWCGNPPIFEQLHPKIGGLYSHPGDCHTSDVGHWFAMTSSFWLFWPI